MRYENWDVLLFPENSKIPIQEFKTQCFVTKDRESPYLHSPSIINPTSYFLPQGNLGHLPVLTTFVPSLPPNTPFRVSIHCWEKPRPSRLMESLMQPDDALLFEIRVFIDGVCVSGSVFGQRTAWPHVIDLSSHIDKNGNQDSLRFPPFHQEILEQRHWDAGELHGRIRIVIAEGFSRPHRSPPFERVKDIIAFSFQHAPLHILEYSNIAWPNTAMWSQGPRMFKYNSGSTFSDVKEVDDSHAHSPTRHENRVAGSSQASNSAMYNAWSYRNFPASQAQWQANAREPRWPTQESFMPDPFIEPYMLEPSVRPTRGARSSLEDVPMPDYSSSASSRAISSMTGISYEHSKQPSITAPMNEEQYHQIFDAMSPPKTIVTGTEAPVNTPSTTVPIGSRPSAAAEARAASYTKSGSRTSLLKEISQPVSRDVSGSSARSTSLTTEAAIETAANKHHPSPSGHVKGKKEGAGQVNKENEGSIDTPIRESLTPSKIAPTSGSIDTPNQSRRNRSGSHVSKEEILVITPTKNLAAVATGDHIPSGSLEDFFDSRIQLGALAGDVAEID
ncbi:hypothetical protein PHISCL_07973 [Aspergillus sclerotialis]|uniref:Uncharacterized protein n=1 Tax=Aspergillus sclerotialis TaxID=2070753 RepID=A0A3A2Z995_9EURO|nr:hypothetical protein PHISCL_07973 [Aspergillus sclerotialis]